MAKNPSEIKVQLLGETNHVVVSSDLMDMDSDGIVMDLSPTVAVRSYFPETWLWDLVTLE